MDFNIGDMLFEKLKELVTEDRVYPDILTYGTKEDPAYLIYKVEEPEIERTIDGTIAYAEIAVSIECYEKQKDAVRTLAQSVIDTLDNSDDTDKGIAKILFIGNAGGYIADDGIWYETLEFNIMKIS